MFKKTLNGKQLFWLTKRSSPAQEKYPYDFSSWNDGRGAVLIDTSLCGLKGNFSNETTLFELEINGTFENILPRAKLFYTQLTCIYANYALHLKSRSFDFVETHA